MGQNILRKQQILSNTEEIETLKKYLSLVGFFKSSMSLQQKMRKFELTPLPTHKWSAPVQVPLDNENLPDEINMLASEDNVKSIDY